MDNKLLIVQFFHPGGEPKPDDGLVKKWNRKPHPHQRKFLKRAGSYVADGKVEKGEMHFWGEWEPDSRVEMEIDSPYPQGPRFIYKPYYVVPKSYNGLQNTDPFVFGNQFCYTGCQQRTKRGATQLRYLLQGSVVLFGSYKDNAFVLDTVFVVDCSIDHSRANYERVLAGAIPQEYKEVTILPWYQEPRAESKSCAPPDSQETWRLYFGVSHERPLQGMYSFFPCEPYKAKSKGFPRPRISLPGIIPKNLKQNRGMKYSEQRSLLEMKPLWDKVTKQVRDQGMALGVYAEMPERRNA